MTCFLAQPPTPVLHTLRCEIFLYPKKCRISLPKKSGYDLLSWNRLRILTSVDGSNAGKGLSDVEQQFSKCEDSKGDSEGGGATSNETLRKLRRYGVAGLLSYGLLNTAYYLTTFLVVWFYVAPAPGKMGYSAAAQRFLKIMAMVWAGSQVTKLFRAGGALALAPFVDRGLSWFTVKFGFKSQGKAFAAIVGVCFGLALVLFFAVTGLSA